MKKFKSLVLLFMFVFLLTGCMKSRTTMTIDNSKNVKYESELLLSDAITNGEMSGESDTSQYEKLGFKVTPLKENGYSGFKFTKDLGNLDTLSNGNGEAVKISDILNDEKFDYTKLFKVEKGFLKNTYTANFIYEVDTEGMDMDGEDDEETTPTENNELLPTDDTVQTTNETTVEENKEEGALISTDETVPTTQALENDGETEGTNPLDNADYTALAAEVEVSYTVNLPVKATSNNATSVLNDGKTLTWKMSYTAPTEIKYSFEMYNMTNLIIIGGGALVVIILLIVIISASKKKKAAKETLIHKDYDPSIAGKIDETTQQPAQAQVPVVENTPVQETAPTETPAAPVEAAPVAPVEAAPVEAAPVTETPVAPVETAPAEPVAEEETPGMIMNDVPVQANNLEFTLPEEQTANHVEEVTPDPSFVDNNVEIQAPTFNPNDRPDFVKDTEEKTFVVPETPDVAPVVEAPVQNGGLDVPPGMALSDIDKNNQ